MIGLLDGKEVPCGVLRLDSPEKVSEVSSESLIVSAALAGLSAEESDDEPSAADAAAEAEAEAGAGAEAEGGGACGADGGAWWWGCNACRCVRGAPLCTRLWCGVPDCLAPGAAPCRPDEVSATPRLLFFL